MKKSTLLTILTVGLFCGSTLKAQEQVVARDTVPMTLLTPAQENREGLRAWEIGIGGTMFQHTRYDVLTDTRDDLIGRIFHTSKKDVMFGGHLYLARELHPNFALDLQADLAFSKDPTDKGKVNRFIGMGTLGLQWRLGHYFDSKYIDPFFRVGAGYMYKNYEVAYSGVSNQDIKYSFVNDHNKSGRDLKGVVPISLGAGVHMWLNDHVGLGLQGDYLYLPYANVANIPQVTARIMWRIGGESKKPQPIVHEIVREIEKPTIVEKIVEVPAKTVVETQLCDLFNNIYFDFDDATLLEANNETIDKIVTVIQQHLDKKFLIIGYTDARGSVAYNDKLGQRRANSVVAALVAKGIDPTLLKAKSAGKRSALIPRHESDNVRRGDRKVVVEVITNEDFWNAL